MKKTIFAILAAFCAALAFSIPGVKAELPDSSGEFVYYRDYSFQRESYVGFLYYDDSTYAVRYFAPESGSDSAFEPKKEIQILFTVDPAKSYLEMTGERITTPVTPDDTDTINYLHDLLYELTFRRQKAGDFTGSTKVGQEFAQFGGNVSIEFDSLVPIFNLRRIESVEKKPLFTLATVGRILSSTDTSFSDFSGLPLKYKDTKHVFAQDKKAKKAAFTYESKTEELFRQKVTLDSGWEQSMENLWSLGKNAVLTVNIIPKSEDADFSKKFTRRLLTGTDHAYPDSNLVKIEEKKSVTQIENTFYNPQTDNMTKDFKILTKLKSGDTAFLSLTVFTGAYSGNEKYFEKILKSYSVSLK